MYSETNQPGKLVNLDLSQLEELSGGDQEFMIEIFEMVNERALPVIDELREACNQGDYPEAKGIAHKFKSTVNILGDLGLNDLVNRVERAAETKDEGTVVQLIDQLAAVNNELHSTINDQITMLRAA